MHQATGPLIATQHSGDWEPTLVINAHVAHTILSLQSETGKLHRQAAVDKPTLCTHAMIALRSPLPVPIAAGTVRTRTACAHAEHKLWGPGPDFHVGPH